MRRAAPAEAPATIELEGDWDVERADALTRWLEERLREGRSLIIDLGRSTFLDSTALGVILNARARWEERGLRVLLVVNGGTAYPVRNALHLLGVDTVLPVFESMDEALGNLRDTR
jgi:anti-anti-sigma factor